MKKFLIVLITCFMLIGCSNSSAGTNKTTVCSVSIEGDTEEVTLTSEDGVITVMKVSMISDVSEFDQTTKDMLLLSLDSEYNNKTFNDDGISTKYEITDNKLIVSVEVSDSDKASAVFNSNRNYLGLKLEDTVAELEKDGATCK